MLCRALLLTYAIFNELLLPSVITTFIEICSLQKHWYIFFDWSTTYHFCIQCLILIVSSPPLSRAETDQKPLP